MVDIKYPHIPSGRKIKYVSLSNEFMARAREICLSSGCIKQPTGAVVVKEGIIIGTGSNAGIKNEFCPRWGSLTGQNYGPCKDVCFQEGHAEIMAIADAEKNGYNIEGADIYLYGHWWCCENCWNAMTGAGIKDVYLLEKSWVLFNPEKNPEMKDWGRPRD